MQTGGNIKQSDNNSSNNNQIETVASDYVADNVKNESSRTSQQNGENEPEQKEEEAMLNQDINVDSQKIAPSNINNGVKNNEEECDAEEEIADYEKEMLREKGDESTNNDCEEEKIETNQHPECGDEKLFGEHKNLTPLDPENIVSDTNDDPNGPQ